MSCDEQSFLAREKTEYETAVALFRHFASLRRQDMAFVTTVQAAVLAILKDHLLTVDPAGFLLTAVAFLALVMGLNNERRLSAYMVGYMERARQIEQHFGMSVLCSGFKKVQESRFLVSNRKTFPLYYVVFAGMWLTIWILNLSR